MTRWFAAGDDDVVLQNSKHTFDSSLWQLMWPLTTGGRTVLPEAGEFLNLPLTVDTIARYQVTATDFVSSIFNALVALVDGDDAAQRKLASLRYLVVGSEEINARAVHRMRELLPQVRITNGYGPTETSIGMVFHLVSDADGDVIPIGAPIDNCYVAVLGEDGAPTPGVAVGVGIGGACEAGYHGQAHRLYLTRPRRPRLFFSGRRDPGQDRGREVAEEATGPPGTEGITGAVAPGRAPRGAPRAWECRSRGRQAVDWRE